jgi:hypothetical protein
MKRLELCDDPAAKEYLRYTTAQMMNGNFNYSIMFEGWALTMGRLAVEGMLSVAVFLFSLGFRYLRCLCGLYAGQLSGVDCSC